jgi:hypothetical protein
MRFHARETRKVRDESIRMAARKFAMPCTSCSARVAGQLEERRERRLQCHAPIASASRSTAFSDGESLRRSSS